MSRNYIYTLLLILLIAAACQPTPAEPPRLQITPFPTMTPGRVLRAPLQPPDFLLAGQSNPATAVAIQAQPSATPDFFTCPPLSPDAALEDTPPQNAPIIIEEILRYLQSGGAVGVLNETLRESWGLLGESGVARDDIDLTGEGRGEVILSYVPPGSETTPGRGMLLIAGCRAGAYELMYEVESDAPTPPALLTLGDMNRDRRNDMLFTVQRCTIDENGQADLEACQYMTRLVTWNPRESRFVNLLGEDLLTFDQPEAADVDQDEVSEVVVRLENRGTTETGPLRTGINVYDWDGQRYTLSIVQYDPPRFKIQVIHEADRAFERGELPQAIALYSVALAGDDLGYWYDDEVDLLQSYLYYKLLVSHVQAGNPQQNDTFQALVSQWPDLAAGPIYAALAQTFITTYQVAQSTSNACADVVSQIAQRPEALSFLNRYGSESPTYTARDLCPF